MSNDDDGDDDVDDDVDDALGRRILEISSLNKKHLHGAEPSPAPSSVKTRTPKRLRSGAKKVSPNSKRRRLSIKYLNDPPPITDTSAIFDSRFRKMADVSVDDAEPRNDGPATPDPKSPVKSWSVSRYESPRGEIKLTLFNRKKKPESSPFLPVNRISRRMTNDTGWNCLIPGSEILALVAGKKICCGVVRKKLAMTDMVNLIHSGCQQPNLQFCTFIILALGHQFNLSMSPIWSQ